jgi:predicted nucleic acid-binding protein
VGKTKNQVISFDSCCWIGLIKGETEYLPLVPYLERIESGSVQVVISAMVLAELLPAHKNHEDSVLFDRITELLDSPLVQIVDVTPILAKKARDYRVTYGLRAPDSIILATAVRSQVDVLFTGDGKIPKGKIEGILVSEPKNLEQPDLFNQE